MAPKGSGRLHSLSSTPGEWSRDLLPPHTVGAHCGPSLLGAHGHHHALTTALATALLLPVGWTGGHWGNPSSRNPPTQAPRSSPGTFTTLQIHTRGSNLTRAFLESVANSPPLLPLQTPVCRPNPASPQSPETETGREGVLLQTALGWSGKSPRPGFLPTLCRPFSPTSVSSLAGRWGSGMPRTVQNT